MKSSIENPSHVPFPPVLNKEVDVFIYETPHGLYALAEDYAKTQTIGRPTHKGKLIFYEEMPKCEHTEINIEHLHFKCVCGQEMEPTGFREKSK